MIRFHGAWCYGKFHIWGVRCAPTGEPLEDESPAATTPIPALSHKHPPVDTAQLHDAFGELIGDSLLASTAEESSLELWMPKPIDAESKDAEPSGAASSEPQNVSLEQSGGIAESEYTWSLKQLPTLALGPAEAMDLLTSLPQRAPSNCGDSLRFWRTVTEYVLQLLSEGQFIPDVYEPKPKHTQGRWRVIPTNRAEAQWVRHLAATMPPVCRAVASFDDSDREPLLLVEDFILKCADALIRRSLAADPFFHQIHERAAGDSPWEVRWLEALIGEENVIRAEPEENVEQCHRVEAWVAAAEPSGGAAPPSLTFELLEPLDADDDLDLFEEEWRLQEPLPDAEQTTADLTEVTATETAPDQRRWTLQFFLQSPSKERIRLGPVWADRGRSSMLLAENGTISRDQLMADFTRAAEAFPLLERVLHHAEDLEHLELTTAEAYAFLRDGAPLLAARGFGVIVPEWADQQERQIGLRLAINPIAPGGVQQPATAGALGLNSLVDFQWRVAIGDTELSIDEFERLRAQRAPLIRLQGRWMRLETDLADRAAQFLQKNRSGQMTLLEAIRAATGAEEMDAGLPVYGVDGAGWIDRLLREAPSVDLEKLKQPEGFAGTLRPYQARGLGWLAFMERIGIGSCLADDMGLGKTIQLIALLLHEHTQHGRQGPTLIFAPTSVVSNWERELQRFASELKVLIHHGTGRLEGDAFVEETNNVDAVVTTYALGHRDLSTLSKIHWRRIVLDEAQKIKNPSAAQTIAIRSLHATHRIAMTGTPLENHLSELWSIMDMVNPGLLGSATEFRKRFAVPIERLGDKNRAEQLRSLVRPFLLRRVKSDPMVECDLPEKMEMRVYCNLTPEQAHLYERVVNETLTEVERAEGIRRRGVILASLTRLKQICNHPAQYLRDDALRARRSGKCERLVEMLEEVLAEGDAALVFTQFREMGDILQKVIAEHLNIEVPFLHGGTSTKQRRKMVERFQDGKGGMPVFLLSLRAGGLGLNLTAANHVFHFDRWWNPAVEDQATDRAHRIGQTKRVQVHKFVCIGTIEDRIDRLLSDKVALADNIVGSGDDWLTSLSTDELRNYLMLSHGAVGDDDNE